MTDIQKYDIVVVNLNPVIGSEQRGIRPCLVLQNNEANIVSATSVVAPFSTVLKNIPHFLNVNPSELNGLSVESRLDLLQIKAIDKSRIVEKIGTLEDKYKLALLDKFAIAFDLEDLF